jgi:tetratricopeptide (TPR) repeat protein
MDLEMGALLLLRRANLIEQDSLLEAALPSDVALAREISKELGGLPLALDQAGAYLEETGESLSGYLTIFKEERATLLKRRGGFSSDHLPVATTWNLAFENIELNNPAAIELIHLFAFLAPDAIPEELFTKTAHHLGPILQPLVTKQILFNEAIKILLDYSLIQRNATTKTLSIHRLIQAVIRDEMRKTKQALWVERIIHMMYDIFPFEGSRQWILGQRYLPHALLATEYVNQWQLTFVAARNLLQNLGSYLFKHGQDSKAESLLQRALTLSEKILGLEHITVAENLNNLANVYIEQDKLDQAESLLQRAIAIHVKVMGFEHPDIVGHLCNLANICRIQENPEQAELVLQRALAIQNRHLGPDHLNRAYVLESIALLCKQQGNFEQAESLLQRALTINEKALGIEHPNTIEALNALNEVRQKNIT